MYFDPWNTVFNILHMRAGIRCVMAPTRIFFVGWFELQSQLVIQEFFLADYNGV